MSFTSSVKNLATSAQENKVVTAATFDLINDEFTVKSMPNKKCKIAISCENAQKLMSEMKAKIAGSSKEYNIEITNFADYIKKTVEVDVKNYQTVFDEIKRLKEQIDKFKTIRDKNLKVDGNASPLIKVHVFVKGSNADDITVMNGTIRTFNISKKSVTVTYPNAVGKTETLENIEINKLCITSSECPPPAQSGGTVVYKNNNDDQDDKNYKIICE